ncbi:hypothetical protein BIW11_09215 [Tropilaelaps mercedesae]|uniref:Papilin-like n=1 Tax=Tropilaelaps mercedesae TaxID=418985 RepID=A0A1V9XL07_9ACAR|nr:hypothetical protein BIW11_09215 [Tropilaelaps mercedesae]
MKARRAPTWVLVAVLTVTIAFTVNAQEVKVDGIGEQNQVRVASSSLSSPVEPVLTTGEEATHDKVIEPAKPEDEDIVKEDEVVKVAEEAQPTEGSTAGQNPTTTATSTDVTTTASSTGPTCAPHTCRMLCPFGFVTDARGCPQCECRQPCAGVQCPGGHECHVDDSACRPGEPCEPMTSCRRAKALSQCSFGLPLTAPSSNGHSAPRPLLCGSAEGKPRCPSGYECSVPTDAEYGLCCPTEGLASGLELQNQSDQKDETHYGECPLSVAADFHCENSPACTADSDCPVGRKCCETSCDTRRCLEARNATSCEQQRRLATLFSEGVEAPGYIPQCDAEGQFISRQCSSNGKICWCVNSAGQQMTGSIGPADEVNCTVVVKKLSEESGSGQSQGRAAFARAHRLKEDDEDQVKDVEDKAVRDEERVRDEQMSHHACSLLMCDVLCEYGYRTDERGCSLCECVDPCEGNTCAQDEECVIVKEEPCKSELCQVSVTCSKKTATPVQSPNGTVPSYWYCASRRPQLVQVHRQSENSSEHLKITLEVVKCTGACADGFDCEIPSGQDVGICCHTVPESMGEPARPDGRRVTVGDAMVLVVNPRREQEGSSEEDDGNHGSRTSVTEEPSTSAPPAVSTMCEYLRELGLRGENLAVPTPVCNEEGRYAARQCDRDGCFCVDDFGDEIRNSRVPAANESDAAGGNSTAGADSEAECRQMRSAKPCYNLLCRLGCDYGFEYDAEGCPMCACRNPCKNARCDADQVCQLAEPDAPCNHRWCPPVPKCVSKDTAQKNLELICPFGGGSLAPLIDAESREVVQCYADSSREDTCPTGHYCVPTRDDSEQGFCCPSPPRDNQLEATTAQEARNVDTDRYKQGQCPYLIPLDTPVAAMSCEMQCNSDSSCPHDLKCCSNGCGTQCMAPVNCTAVRLADGNLNSTTCNVECNVQCEFGEKLDSKGCSLTCECIDPCEHLSCGANEECRLVELACASHEPCGRQALCRPKIDNVCAVGSPLKVNDTLVNCGIGGEMCPTSHKCQLDIFGEFAQCCPKPREICFSAPPMCVQTHEEPTDVQERWFYNPMERQCQPFRYNVDYCQHGLNFFSSAAECEGICPTYTECELMREKTRTQAKNSGNTAPVYVPKCNSRLGTWEPLQCMHDLGLCWCVDQKGNQIAGSMVRGTPNCSDSTTGRSGRNLTPAAICPGGEPVHICDAEEVCGEKICAARTNATCRVDPCGGCKAVFFDEVNNVVDCSKGLTACQEEAQQVVNSRAWTNQGLNTISNLVSALRELSEGMIQDELAQSSRLFASPIEMMASQVSNFLPMPHELLHRVRRSPKVVFDDVTTSHSRTKRETLSDEISDYDDPAARAMSAYHQNRRRLPVQEPIAEYSAPPKVVVPLRAPIIMVVHRRVAPRPPVMPSPLDIMQALSSTMPRMRVLVRLPVDSPIQHPTAASEPIQQRSVLESREEGTSSYRPILPGGVDPALFMSHITSIMERVMGNEGPAGPLAMPQHPSSGRIVVGPSFAEVKMTVKSETPVPAVAMRHIEQGSLDTLLNYLFGPNHAVTSGQHEHEASSQMLTRVTKKSECPRGGFAEAIIHSMVSGCRTACHDDSDCSGADRCCKYGCSTACVTPVVSDAVAAAAAAAAAAESEVKAKPGNCPAPVLTSTCLFPKIRCMEDGHCPAEQKCCKGPCGATCQMPVDESPEPEASMPPMMVVAPPVCSADGGYAVSQSQGQFAWCVNRFGVPIDATLTKGHVACDVNGTITKKESFGDVCPKGQTAKVCRDECSSSICFGHPDAMCVADPCNECAIHFVDAAGDKVDCEATCDQTAFKTVPCHANSGIRPRVRYTFNQTSQQCERFEYQCNGNDNNFESVQECEQLCKKPKSVCELPKDSGLCMGAFMKWWFNPITAECEEFTYGGCGGNANNFETKAACDMRCPDLVLCPYDTITKEGLTREPCDRLKACASVSCPGDPAATCQVDPCDCRALWINAETGEPAQCDRPVTPPNADISEMVNAIAPKCQTLQKKNAVLKHVYIPECDSEGAFLPTQCISLPMKKECWCVDAAGHQTGEPFSAGSKTCAPVKISRVDMDLAFVGSEPMGDEIDKQLSIVTLADGLKRALRSIDADFREEEMRVENTAQVTDGASSAKDDDNMIHARFTLRGTDSANMAYKIEQLVMGKMLRVGDQVAEYKNSRFTYVAEEDDHDGAAGSDRESRGDGSGRVEVIYSADRNEVLAVKRLLEPRTVDARTTTLAAAVLAVTVVMCILLLLTLLMHKRSKQKQLAKESVDATGSMPCGAVAFPNPVYAIWTNRVMSAVCRRSPVPSPPKSPDDLARMEAQQSHLAEGGIDSHLDNNDDVDNEFNNPSYEVFEDSAAAASGHATPQAGAINSSRPGVTINLNGRRPPSTA